MLQILSRQSNFTQRLVSICIFTPLLVFAILWSKWTYFFLFSYVMIFTMLEFYKLMAQAHVIPLRGYGIYLALLSYTLTFAYYTKGFPSFLLGYILTPFILFPYIIVLYRQRSSNPFLDIAATLLGILYIALPCSMLHCLAFFPGIYAKQLILGLLSIIWSQDIGAYLVGTLIGRLKLFQRISPKKTWEGVIGGALFALATSYGVATFDQTLSLWQWMAIALISIFTATYGDLVASLLKRSVGVKNASEHIPGHGGFLDRMDSLLLTIPTVVVFLKISSLVFLKISAS